MSQVQDRTRIVSGTLVVSVLLGVLVLPRSSVARDWDLARDFNTGSNDGADTWQYFRVSDGHLDGSYDRLIDLASSGEHYDVKVDPTSLRQLTAWVDAICPYRGDEEIRALPDPEFPGIEDIPIRPRVKTAPIIQRPNSQPSPQ